MIAIEKLVMKKWMEYSSNLNFVGGQITKDGVLLLIESSLKEIDFFQRPIPKNNWTIRMIKGETIETINLKNVPLIPSEVDVFSDGSLLIVQSRCRKDGHYIERNARRYNSNGELIEAFTLGDGISQVQIDETNTIWVSYFDEGIFGNFGWEQPIGSDGLIAYTMNGSKLWSARDYEICDCYGLNVVSSNEVYFYYYDDLNLVQLKEMKESIRYRVEGNDSFQQFIIDQAGLIGQIDLYSLKRFRIRNRTITPKEKLQLTDTNGKRINGPVFMRGKFLYAYGKDGVYTRSL
ncbi:hypothetical protein R4Z10_09240 [Niallia sp. XMNu-256]|uniref:hypothetical protein n=1 Tax=Niallia sp. XMNu-256 TaxID=3082444 RepID=UPI0030D36F0F